MIHGRAKTIGLPLVLTFLGIALFSSTALAQATLSAPSEVAEGAYFYIDWTGPGNNGDQIVIVPQGAAAGTFSWAYPAFPRSQTPIRMGLDKKIIPGAYELRYVGHPGSAQLATRSITVVQGVATLDFPTKVLAGSQVEVNWTGPGMEEDKIAIGKTGKDERYWKVFSFVDKGNPLFLKAPGYTGKYMMRYYMGHSAKIITAVPFEIVDELPPEEEILIAEADTVGTEQTVDPVSVGVLDDETISSTEQTVETGASDLVLNDDEEDINDAEPRPQTIQAGTFKFTGFENTESIINIGSFRFVGGAVSEVPVILDIGTFKFTGDSLGEIQPNAIDIGTFKFTGDSVGQVQPSAVIIGNFKFTGTGN